MKKTISILLLSLMGLSMFGLYPAFKLLQLHTREVVENEIRENLLSKNLEIFADPQNNKDITWEQGEEEFRYDGRMYDVVKKETRNGTSLYYCYSDREEANIVSNLEKLSGHEPLNNKTTAGIVSLNLLKLLVQAFIPSENIAFPRTFRSEPVVAQHTFHDSKYADCFIKVVIPPPKIS